MTKTIFGCIAVFVLLLTFFRYPVLATAWDLSTESYSGINVSVSAQIPSNLSAMTLSADGTKMYVARYNTKTIYQYNLATAWDVSTAIYANKSFVTSDLTGPVALYFKPDGRKLFVTGFASRGVFQYSLSSPWDISTATYDNVSFSTSAQDANGYTATFSPDGNNYYMGGTVNKKVYQYSLSTPWDVSTMSYTNKSYLVSQPSIAYIYGLYFKSDGTKMFVLTNVVGNTTGMLYQYSLSIAWDPTSASYDSVSMATSAQDSAMVAIYFNSDGSTFYLAGQNTGKVYEYSLPTPTATPQPTSTFTLTPTPTSSQNNSSSSGNSSSNPTTPSCSDAKPPSNPNLFQIDVVGTHATLYYAPLSGGVSDYYISFSANSNTFQHGVTTGQSSSTGVLSYTVNMLNPSTAYYFRIRGQNGCIAGDWSNEMKIISNGRNSITKTSYYSNAPAKSSNTVTDLMTKIRSTPTSLNVSLIPTPTRVVITEPKKKPIDTLQHVTNKTTSPKKTCFIWWCW